MLDTDQTTQFRQAICTATAASSDPTIWCTRLRDLATSDLKILRSGDVQARADRETARTKGVTHVSGINRNPCGQNGHNRSGAARGIRTPDPIITNDVLYRLSYCGPGAVITPGWGHCKQGLRCPPPLAGARLAEQRPPPAFLLWLRLGVLGFGRRWALRTRIVRRVQEGHRRWLRLRW